MPKKESTTNLASEFYVASQLFRLGCTVTLTLGHTKEIDIIAITPKGRKVTIDVKGLKNTTNWPVKPKSKNKDHFFVLVTYRNRYEDINSQPEVYIIPARKIKQVLGKWSKTRKGKEVSAVGYKKVRKTKFKGAWELITKYKP